MKAALALPAIQASDLAQAHALYVGAALAESQSDYAEARQMLETCLALRRGLGNPVDIAATLSTLSLVRLKAGDANGAAVGEREALQIFREIGDRVGEAIGLLHLGQIGLTSATMRRRCRAWSNAWPSRAKSRNRRSKASANCLLGEVAFEVGDATRAYLRFMRSLSVCSEDGDKRGEANALWWLGKAALQAGETAVARTRLGEALQAFRDFEMREELLGCLEDHAVLARLQGEVEAGVRLAATAQAYRSRLDLVRSPQGERKWEARLDALRSHLPAQAFAEVWNAGSNAELESAIRAAHTLLVPRTVN